METWVMYDDDMTYENHTFVVANDIFEALNLYKKANGFLPGIVRKQSGKVIVKGFIEPELPF